MEITTGSPDWDEVVDRGNWSIFLATETGKRLIPKAIEACPALLAGGGVNEILIRSGEARGFSFVVQALLALALPEPKAPEATSGPTNYPPLDDDKQWADGQKVNS